MSTVLDVSDALNGLLQTVRIKTVTRTTTDFEPTNTVTGRDQQCVVQVAEKENVNPDTLDWSKEYIMVHSPQSIEIDELIEHDSKDFIVTQKGPWRGYGYFEVVAVETKEPVVQET